MTTEAARPRRQTFSDRLAGRVPDLRPDHDLSPALGQALTYWVDRVACRSAYPLDRKVALALGIPGAPDFERPATPVSFRAGLLQTHGPELLDVVDAVLDLHPERGRVDLEDPFAGLPQYGSDVRELDEYFVDAGSAYRVASDWSGLELRLDDTVTLAAEQTVAASPDAGAFLAEAWRRTYGLHPDPTTAYRDAVRAVEQVACPLVLPTDQVATLGKVITHLRDVPRKWQFALVDKDGDGSVEPVVAMLDRLWTGQVSRHGGGRNSRDQTTEEARVAVHLATTLVQLLGAGALTRRTTP